MFMKVYKKFVTALCLIALAFPTAPLAAANDESDATNNYVKTAALYERIANIGGEADEANTAMLNLFMTRMPKGGDLHHHYSGTIYAETYLQWVKQKGWWIDKNTLRILQRDDIAGSAPITVDELAADNLLYRRLMTLWSDRDFDNHFHNQPPPDVNFFNTFGYFGPISSENIDLGLKIIKQRALDENTAYIETQLKRVGISTSTYFDDATQASYNERLRATSTQAEVDALLDEITKPLANNGNFTKAVQDYIARVDGYHQGIDEDNFMMRYQTYAVRVLPPLQVFMDLWTGYLAANGSDIIVGTNIVAPENNAVALADYTLHMRMYNYLLNKYPNVGRSLHAGELTLGMVRPEDLRFHIKQARDIAQAQRIGHGIDLPYEKDNLALLQDLKENAVVEINLTSNEFILGVSGNAHPYLIYEAYGVPMVISTDDEGVSRNNLTSQYVLLATRYQPSYAAIKQYVYNNIRHAFLTEREKQKLKATIDHQFVLFEKEMATLH